MYHVKQWRIILVDDDDYLLSRLLIGTSYNADKARVGRFFVFSFAVKILVGRKEKVKIILQ